MRKILVASLLLMTILLSACSGKSTVTTTPTPSGTAVPTPVGAKPGECQIAPSIFQPQPAAATYAPISASDHVLGPDTALMTIIEYSDFT